MILIKNKGRRALNVEFNVEEGRVAFSLYYAKQLAVVITGW